MNSSRSTLVGILLAITTLVVAICLCCAIGAAVYLIVTPSRTTSGPILPDEQPGSAVIAPTELPPTTAPDLPGAIQPSPTAEGARVLAGPILLPSITETVRTLENTLVPQNDPIDLAARLQATKNIPQSLEPRLVPLQTGEQENFWVTNTDTNENSQVTATLQYLTDHLYFWVENGLDYNRRDIKRIAEAFESKIYPTTRQFFGSEWTPGVDGDPRIHILYTSNVGFNVAGYYSSADEFLPQVNEFSNAKEIFFINADVTNLRDEYTYGLLAHEFQHMISWNQDRNEDIWMNEGFSELAAYLAGYDTGDAIYFYLDQPDLSLTDWPSEPDVAHYGASFHFLAYFLNRFGEQATKVLAGHPANGLTSVDEVLKEIDARDASTNQLMNADQVFADWAVTNYLQETATPYLPGKYPVETDSINGCPERPEPLQVHQYGVDYIRIGCRGSYTLRFEGSPTVDLVPTSPHSGSYAFWSNTGSESDMTLTKSFDLTDHAGPLTLDYWTWYDIEEDYDYAYLLSSIDGGNTWQILTTPDGTPEDPTGASFGWAYNGSSGGLAGHPQWVKEQVDISALAGQNAQIRFEYVTDGAVNGNGLLVDDIAIPEIGYATDFENDGGGWEAAGFARVQNHLPQNFRVTVIEEGDHTKVTRYALAGQNVLELPIEIGKDVDEIILVVSGTTRITQQLANYNIQIIK